ncbi:ARM repeat-containing protein [Exidia glandulosa HHB12029]|uniref:ARM repeat-containing protein n=1 Tax=Exidia glandulosa HHB12029 TaxID=1314781 RepID=A0A165PFQ8_EXIGL|nr:ARM repeat-containing protein [Exidia glandulosa HHB12029]
MDGDDSLDHDSSPPSGAETPKTTGDNQLRASLKTYLDSLPYDAESPAEMDAKLDEIVQKLAVCAHARDWNSLTTWDSLLQCWLLMRYPITRPVRAGLVKFYYQLILVPGMEPRIIRTWADMIQRLLASKPGMKRKLELTDLELPWEPLWRIMRKELWPKGRNNDASRNVVNILLFVADLCKRYFPPSEIPKMLDTFIPLLTQESILSIVPVLISFLPPTDCHLYVPVLFKFWEAFNSHVLDERMLELMGALAEEHVAGKAGEAGGAEWKEIGIFTEEQFAILVGKCLNSMNVPVGSARGSSTTGTLADIQANRQALKIKKPTNRFHSLAQILIYSMSVDGCVRGEERDGQPGYLGGSKALDALDKIITSTESYFHPSNSGHWTISLTNFMQQIVAKFANRWKEEEQSSCKTPVTQRLTPALRRAVVKILRTPALLSMFSKDLVATAFAQTSLRGMALLEPDLIMPQILEKAYSGLESVNETHRTTAVMNALSGVSLPLVNEKMWLGGQKHIVPLLELCLPGIDLNDPMKTICATMFIIGVVQYVKIGELTSTPADTLVSSEVPGEDISMTNTTDRLPFGVEPGGPAHLSRLEEAALTRESSSGFADWVVSFFRRVLALYENLPEEGGKKNTTGGKQEETVLKSLKSTMDVICLHLSDPLFDLVLKLVFDYATSNARSNSVRAFGQLVACLARVKPEATLAKFMPFCIGQIVEELKYGASSVRTNATHVAAPSDTTLHWNMAILRGVLGYGGSALLKYKDDILNLLLLLMEKTKSERGFSSAGRLMTRIMHTLSEVYPLNSRFVNTEEWDDPEFDVDHFKHWGKMYDAEDVKIEWHTPSPEEIEFILELLDKVVVPAMDVIDRLLQGPDQYWDNDFCRYMHMIRSAWSGLPTLIQEPTPEFVPLPDEFDTDVVALRARNLKVRAGFTLTDPQDPRYQHVANLRKRFGDILHRGSVLLRQQSVDEDHIDPVLALIRAIDVHMLEYGVTRQAFSTLTKNHAFARNLNRVWNRQRHFSRLIFLKRAQVYHSGRVYVASLYRQRNPDVDSLLEDLVEFSLSPYTRIRRHSQAVLVNVASYFVGSTRFILPKLFDALNPGTPPDRMKGALYVLSNKPIAAFALYHRQFSVRYMTALLECQHQEKPSIQKLVASVINEALPHFTEEALQTQNMRAPLPAVAAELANLQKVLPKSVPDSALLQEATSKMVLSADGQDAAYNTMIKAVIEIAQRPTTHWRYSQAATRILGSMVRRDIAPSAELAKLFIAGTCDDHPTMRWHSQRGVVRVLHTIKMRSYGQAGAEELWFNEWRNPLSFNAPVKDGEEFLRGLEQRTPTFYVDKLLTGFVAWSKEVPAYRLPPEQGPVFTWEQASQPALLAIQEVISQEGWFDKLAALYAQESNRASSNGDLRQDNITFIKSLVKMFEGQHLEKLLSILEPLWQDSDRFKQRAAAEIVGGVMRGLKHWPASQANVFWNWMLPRLPKIYAQIKPDSVNYWESVFSSQLADRDPRRNEILVQWILTIPLDFNGESAFTMSKSIGLVGILADMLGIRFEPVSERYINALFDNAHTQYAEIRGHIAQNIDTILRLQWHPSYPSTDAFIEACRSKPDPLLIRHARYEDRMKQFIEALGKWKHERLPPPRVNQSTYDKVGLTLLQWLWIASHGAQAPMIFAYVSPLLPEILRMSELNDSSELQTYSSAVLYVLSAVTPPVEYIELIADHFVDAVRSSTSWRIRLNALPTLVVFFYRNLTSFSDACVQRIMDLLLECLFDENVEVREMAAKALSGVIRCSQRQSILPLKDRFVQAASSTTMPPRSDERYAGAIRTLHGSILGITSLIEAFPYAVEAWMPPLTEVLASHATDPPPIATTIRNSARQFKKTHQDTWHTDQLAFNDDELQALSTMLSGISYYA